MSEIKLNVEQTAFVKNTKGNMLVSASAGSGKTTTMIYKLINLIVEHNVPVQSLLVVTFTDAAAQEMKQKLYFELINNIKTNNYSEEKLKQLYSELDNIMVADIGTVHSVCKKIVTKYFYAVSVEPNFKIIANVEHQSMFNTALNNVFNNYVTNNDAEFFEVFESFNEKRNFNKLKNIITELYNFLSEQTNADGWFYKILDQTTNTDFSKNESVNFLFNYYHSNLSGYVSDFKALLNVAETISEKQTQIVSDYYNYAKLLSEQNCFTNLSNLIFNAPSFNRLVAINNPEFLEYYETLKLTVNAFKKVLLSAKENLVSNNFEEIKQSSNNLRKIELKLYEITKNVEIEFSRLKQNAGVLDFSDLQKLTLQILEDDKIKAELKQNYSYIFVDEYQDINQIQEDIILSLTSGNNLYMIGDIKQSIYAFRQCKPEIFLNKYNLFNSDGVNNKLLKLNENYRSSKNIINFANMIFNSIITTNTIGINYLSDAQLKGKLQDSGNVKLNIINTNSKKNTDSDETENNDNELDKEQTEAIVVLNEINNVLYKPYFDAKTNSVKNINYCDIAILTRDSKDFVINLYKLLSDHKLPVSANFKQSIFNSSEVTILYSLLKVVANSTQEVELATVLHSVMFNVSNNELAQIKLEGKYDGFYENVLNYSNFGTNLVLSDKISAFWKEINAIRNKLSYSTISEILDYVINKYDLKSYYYALPDGVDRITNIEVFLELVKNDMFNFNLNKCLEFLESLTKKDDFTVSTKSTDNSIKILTMHKSKGLEYPCVILCNMGKSFNLSARRADMVISEKLGIGLNYKDTNLRVEYSTIQKRANVLHKVSEELNEQIRLLYVALTRAKNYLTIVGSYDLSKLEFNVNRSVKFSTNFLDLIFKGINKSDIGAFNLKPSFSLNYNGEKICDVNVTNPKEVTLDFTNDVVELNQNLKVESVVNNIVKNVTNTNFSSNKLIATKNSVSGLLEDENYVNISETNLTLNISDSDIQTSDSLKLGTAYHTVMQNINYLEEFNFDSVISKLVASGKLEKELANKINKNQIENAYLKIKELIKPDTKIFTEKQFLLNTSYNKISEDKDDVNVLIQGVVDLILINGNEAIIIDFKTNKTSNEMALKQKYTLQLKCYELAVAEGFKVKVKSKMLYLFNLNKFISL